MENVWGHLLDTIPGSYVTLKPQSEATPTKGRGKTVKQHYYPELSIQPVEVSFSFILYFKFSHTLSSEWTEQSPSLRTG